MLAAPWAFSTPAARSQQDLQQREMGAALRGAAPVNLGAEAGRQAQSSWSSVGAAAMCAGAVGLAASRRASAAARRAEGDEG